MRFFETQWAIVYFWLGLLRQEGRARGGGVAGWWCWQRWEAELYVYIMYSCTYLILLRNLYCQIQ